MGKAKKKRRQWRQEHLSNLAKTNPEGFQKEWWKRVNSWLKEASHRAGRLLYENKAPVPRAFHVAEKIMAELLACGEEAINLVGSDTQEVVTDHCRKVVASACTPKWCRLTNYQRNYNYMLIAKDFTLPRSS